MYETDVISDGNLMLVGVFKFMFPKPTVAKLHATDIIQSC